MGFSGAKQTQHGESLEQALYALAYRQITVFALLTLAFAAPLSCQQHALMSLLDVDWTAYNSHTNQADAASSCALHEHQPGGVQMSLAAFAGMLPVGPLVHILPRPSGVITGPILLPTQPVTLPPEQPPRVL